MLIATSDIGVMFLAEHADRLADRFIFPKQDATLVRSLANKKTMYHLARNWNVPAPETSFPQSRSDVLEYLSRSSSGGNQTDLQSSSGSSSCGVSIARTESELLERYDAVEDPSEPNVILQEYVPGGDEATWVLNGYFDTQGVCRMAFTGRKIRNFPAYFGQASCGVCLKNNEVEQTTIRFMTAIGYKGGLDLGYRYDARDGRYKIFDINPRLARCFVALLVKAVSMWPEQSI